MTDRNSRVGIVALNTSVDAVWMKVASIKRRRIKATPINSITNTGAVTLRVCRTTGNMAKLEKKSQRTIR